jgi:hypothetical protein
LWGVAFRVLPVFEILARVSDPSIVTTTAKTYG